MNTGIYKIINLIDGKYYVGSSTNIYKRWKEHIRLLNNNQHHNDHLQYAWNKYGKKSFNFVIVENTEITSIKIIEQKYLDVAKYEPDKSYNLNYDATGGKISEYSKEKIKKNKLEYWTNFEKRKMQSEKLKKIKSTPEMRQSQSIRAKVLWTDDFYREKFIEAKKMWHSLPINKKRVCELNSGLNNPMSDKKKYYFFNKKTKNKEYCTRYELRTNPKYLKENLSQSGIAQLCLGKFPSYKGWIIDTSQLQ